MNRAAADLARRPSASAASRVAPWLLLLGLGVVVIGAFLPWVWSGSSARSSFALVRSVDRLGLVDDGPGLLLLRMWYGVPLVGAAVVALETLHYRRAAALVGLALATVIAATALLVVVVAPNPGPGPVVCIVGAAFVVAAAIVTLVGGRVRPDGPAVASST